MNLSKTFRKCLLTLGAARNALNLRRAIETFAEILALGAFERFVYVMSILEGQSEQDCAVLLRCSRRDVMIARVLALTRLSNTDDAYAEAGEVV